ncbi:hypothetical protein [Streptomyces sp. NPDC047028]|uniref:hypothetical protein n=1 Tax=Streptomyces sp. NPDC047028 TaxID=3155793 RepID=UPI0033FA708E
MGIESDQVVYEYLSRVGDIAQQRQLPSGTRMRLVSELRNEIDRRRAKTPVDSPAAVRRIIARLGSPAEVVEAAGGTPAGPQAPAASVPVQPEPRRRDRTEPEPEERPKGLRRVVPRPRPEGPKASAVPPDAASPPHLAPAHELGDSVTQLDWWRVEGSPFGPGEMDAVPGFVGGVEIPELLKRPPKETEPEAGAAGPQEETGPGALDATDSPAPARQRSRRLLPRPATGWSNPLLLLAAAALVAGAVLGNWFALLLGWLIAYGSRRLSPAETKWAVLVLPGAALAAGLVWLWGRDNGRWGTPIAQGHMSDAVSGTWPWIVRGAAVASALYLIWRSQRRA